jgi:hypothetical protein
VVCPETAYTTNVIDELVSFFNQRELENTEHKCNPFHPSKMQRRDKMVVFS